MKEISDKQTKQVTIESFLAVLQGQKTQVGKIGPFLWYGLLNFVTD